RHPAPKAKQGNYHQPIPCNALSEGRYDVQAKNQISKACDDSASHEDHGHPEDALRKRKNEDRAKVGEEATWNPDCIAERKSLFCLQNSSQRCRADYNWNRNRQYQERVKRL